MWVAYESQVAGTLSIVVKSCLLEKVRMNGSRSKGVGYRTIRIYNIWLLMTYVPP